MARRRKRLPKDPCEAEIECLAQDGRGVTHIDGKAVFIHGALPGEQVDFIYERKQGRYDEGRVHQVLRPSLERTEPRCPHFGLCGGCSMQHLEDGRQIQHKERALFDAFAHIGGIGTFAQRLPPLVAGRWGYRRKARLGAKYVHKKEKLLVGFRERGTSFVADLQACEVLHPRLGRCLPQLAALIDGLSIREQVPQVELSMGDEQAVLIFRLLETPKAGDLEALSRFGREQNFIIYIQEAGPGSVRPLGQEADLYYTLPEQGLRLDFLPLDFTQVNLELNRRMVARALDLLDPQPGDRILDLFCGIGNFTLPLATRAGEVTGVEGDDGLVQRAKCNAVANGLENTRFHITNLYSELEVEPWLAQGFDKLLLDPPRSGAAEILPYLRDLDIQRILYISCNPSTLARDAGVLVKDHGYKLVCAGVMDMFPHTSHVESMALFEA